MCINKKSCKCGCSSKKDVNFNNESIVHLKKQKLYTNLLESYTGKTVILESPEKISNLKTVAISDIETVINCIDLLGGMVDRNTANSIINELSSIK